MESELTQGSCGDTLEVFRAQAEEADSACNCSKSGGGESSLYTQTPRRSIYAFRLRGAVPCKEVATGTPCPDLRLGCVEGQGRGWPSTPQVSGSEPGVLDLKTCLSALYSTSNPLSSHARSVVGAVLLMCSIGKRPLSHDVRWRSGLSRASFYRAVDEAREAGWLFLPVKLAGRARRYDWRRVRIRAAAVLSLAPAYMTIGLRGADDLWFDGPFSEVDEEVSGGGVRGGGLGVVTGLAAWDFASEAWGCAASVIERGVSLSHPMGGELVEAFRLYEREAAWLAEHGEEEGKGCLRGGGGVREALRASEAVSEGGDDGGGDRRASYSCSIRN